MSGEFGSGGRGGEVAMRDLAGARKAYADGDLEASKAAHADKRVGHVENHSKVGGKIKSIVFGGLVLTVHWNTYSPHLWIHLNPIQQRLPYSHHHAGLWTNLR